MTNTSDIAQLGGAPVGGAPTGVPITNVSAKGADAESASVRGPPGGVDRLVSIKETLALVGSPAVSTLYRWIADGSFPKPVQIGPGRVGVKMSAIQAWIASRVEVG